LAYKIQSLARIFIGQAVVVVAYGLLVLEIVAVTAAWVEAVEAAMATGQLLATAEAQH
jgi:hypothetical protein